MRVLITGGAGFIGSNLCRKLVAEGYEVCVLDNLSTGDRSNIADLEYNSLVRVVEGDVVTVDYSQLGVFDIIYHLACPASPPKYQADPISTLDTSYIGTKRILEYAVQIRARVLFSSTSEVYGDPTCSPQSELYRGNVNTVGPRACYDEGKRVAETLCYEYCRQQGVDVSVFRIFNTYGPFMDPDDGRVITNFINQALRGEPLTIYGDGTQTRSFQYIDDLIDAIMLLTYKNNFFGPVNIGNPNEFTILELAQKVLSMVPYNPDTIVFLPLPQDDPIQRKPDISLAKTELGWEPAIELDEGLSKTIAYFMNYQSKADKAGIL